MSTEALTEWFRRRGFRVVRTRSSWWCRTEPGVFRAIPPQVCISPDPSEVRNLLWRHGALAAQYSTSPQAPRGVARYRLIQQEPRSLDELDGELRRSIETARARHRLERMPLDRLAEMGWTPGMEAFDLLGSVRIRAEASWKNLCQAASDLPGFEAWAATSRDGIAAAVVVAAMEEGTQVVCLARRAGSDGDGALALLLQELGQEHLQRGEAGPLFGATRSGLYDAPFEELQIRLGAEPELIRHRVELHPLCRILGTSLVHRWVRNRLMKEPRTFWLARVEGLLQAHREGDWPLEEQAWPAQLRPVRERMVPRSVPLLTGDGFEVTYANSFDVNALVDLHEACFTRQEHILVQLGRPFLRAVYRWFVNSPNTFALVARQGDRILGLTTVSDSPYNLPMLVACRRELLAGCLAHPLAVFNLELILRLVRIAFQGRPDLSGSEPEKVGQIAFTGVAPDCQGQGIGKALKAASIRVCRERGMAAVSTGVRRQNARARLMNEQAGFVVVPEKSTSRLIYLRLNLHPAPAPGDIAAQAGPTGAEADLQPAEPRRVPQHIVIVTAYYWPVLAATTQLMKDLAEGLAEGGNHVTVLTNGPGLSDYSDPDHPLLEGRINRIWNPFLRRMGVFPKVMEYFWFMFSFVLHGLAIRKADLIFVSSTPPLAGLPASFLARLKGAKLVYNLQDIFPDSAVLAGMLPARGWLYKVFRKAEEATYRCSDLVASISPSFSEYVQRLVPGTQVATIPNWVDTDHIRPQAPSDPGLRSFLQEGSFVVQYAGNLGFMQNLEVVLSAAERLKAMPDIRFVFIGDGNAKRSLQEHAVQKGLTNCIFLPLQPLEKVPEVYNACDVGVIPLKAGAAQIAVPSKTWNYLAAGRPVIGCVEEDSPLAGVIRESRSGSVISPSDSERLAEVILGYRNSPERARMEGGCGREYVENHLSRRVAIREYLHLFDGLLAKHHEED